MKRHAELRWEKRARRMVFATAVVGSLLSIFLLVSLVEVLAPSNREAIDVGADIEAPLPSDDSPVLLRSGTATVVIESVNGAPVATVGHCRRCQKAHAIVRGAVVVCGACGQTMARVESAEAARGCQRPVVPSQVSRGMLHVAAADIQHSLNELQRGGPAPVK